MRSPRRIVSLSLLSAVFTAMIATTVMFQASLAADPAPRSRPALVERSARAPAAVPADVEADAGRYAAAERDAAAKDAREFKGGAAVVIVGSTAALVLGIILLIVLL
jgi:hypothetical protein